MHYRRWWRQQPGNKERERVANAAAREKNPHAGRARSRRHYHKNKDRLAAKHAAWQRSPSGRFHVAVYNAKQAGRAWTLTKERWLELTACPCHYCHGPLNETGSGLDRLDNSRGYDDDNVVPCCRDCNMMRGRRLTPEETYVLARVLRAMREGQPYLTYLSDHTTTAPT